MSLTIDSATVNAAFFQPLNRALIAATHTRPCSQRAMVYRREAVRHERILKPRLPQEEIDVVVESQAICCFHHDAFRFCAAKARPLRDRLIGSLRTTLVAATVFGLVMQALLGDPKTPPQRTVGRGTGRPTNF